MFTNEDNITTEEEVGELVASFNSNQYLTGFDLTDKSNELAGSSETSARRSEDKGGLSGMWARYKHKRSNSKSLS